MPNWIRTHLAAVALLSLATTTSASEVKGVSPAPGAQIALVAVVPEGAEDSQTVAAPQGMQVVVSSSPLVTTADIVSVAEVTDSNGQPALDLVFNTAAAARLQKYSAEHVGQQIAFVVDDQVYITSYISGPFSSSMRLSGLQSVPLQRSLFDKITKPHR